MPRLLPSIACNLDADLLAAALPLFESEKVQAVEWSFDTLFRHEDIPTWYADLMQECGNQGRLVGHGVFFSLFSGKWLPEQQDWLKHLARMARRFPFDHISEHFGFMTGQDFHKGAPLSVPFTPTVLALGQDRLRRIQEACECPVGLENLAFAYSVEEVKRHGDFLGRLVESVNGFIILDLHNLYCQLHNFDLAFEDLIRLYPLEKVREIHISGGSWENSTASPGKKTRRDTHDDAVPNAVFDLLAPAIARCPHVKYVVLEQLGIGLATAESQVRFRDDFYRMEEIVARCEAQRASASERFFCPENRLLLADEPLEDAFLAAQQTQLSHILETAVDWREAQRLLRHSSLAQSDWQVEQWQPQMLEAALAIAQKWKNGFE
jgi:uncharacterized protein